MTEDFFKYQAQTTPFASGMEVASASNNTIVDVEGNTYLDMVAGVGALPLGHCHPAVVKAIHEQAASYMHVMVYGEYTQAPAVKLCKKIASLLPEPLEMTYLVNSGTEAIEASLKLARRVTGRSQIIAMKNAYHGNSLGSLSLMDYEERKAPFRPLLPGIDHISFNCFQDLVRITTNTAAVIIETIQGGAGFIIPNTYWLQALEKQCKKVGALLILDEIQPGIGRTGTMFHFTQHHIIPDVVVTGKALAGGMPIGALTASREHMEQLKDNPILGHITTFGGHPVIAAAALATLESIEQEGLMEHVGLKELRFRESLQSKNIVELRGAGLMLAAMLPDSRFTNDIVAACHARGVIFFTLLYEKRAIRITPPLTITLDEIDQACRVLTAVVDEFYR